ncbi:MAG: hypothetical protein WBP85_07625 [Terracidiphilus sp.]
MLTRKSYAGAIFALVMMFMWNSASAKAQNASISFGTGLGELTYTTYTSTDTCYIEWSEEYTVPYNYSVTSYSGFKYTPPSTTGLAAVSITGGFSFIEFSGPAAGSGLSDSCPTSTPIGGSTPITYKGTNSNYGYTITLDDPYGELGASFSLNGTAGFITPKYVVMGVTYAPPGASSYVQYTNTTSVGNTTTISNSFSNDAGFSVSDSATGNIPAGWFNGSFTITATESTDYTQGSSNSTTNTLTKATTVAYKTNGTPTEAPVNSDYDYIWIWVNPELFITYTAPFSSYPGYIKMTGYGMDPNDPVTGKPQTGVTYTAGPDVIEVQVGCLNGHFSCPSDLVWNSGEAPGSFVTSGLLARTWQSTANGYNWPSGEQSGLSYDDVCAILNIDPFAVTPSQCPTKNDYTALNSLPSTSSDGRFSKLAYPPNPVQYPVGGGNESYNMVQSDTQSQSTGNSSQIKQAFSVAEKFNTSAFWGLVSNTITFKESDTLTWNYSSLNTITTTTTLTDALSITGPPTTPPYPAGQPVEFIGYQDNTFGTFAFMPVDYCPSGSIICTQ